jgi:CheY-like chemotaxis protein
MPKVLIVNDEKVIANTLAKILSQSGFETRTVYSGEEAVATAPEFKPDILLSDVNMYELNGIEAAIHIRAMLPSTRVILNDGARSTADLLNDARDRGHEFEILPCPVHPRVLIDTLSGDTNFRKIHIGEQLQEPFRDPFPVDSPGVFRRLFDALTRIF